MGFGGGAAAGRRRERGAVRAVAYWAGGWSYVLLVVLAGLGYALAFRASGRNEMAILAHFGPQRRALLARTDKDGNFAPEQLSSANRPAGLGGASAPRTPAAKRVAPIRVRDYRENLFRLLACPRLLPRRSPRR